MEYILVQNFGEKSEMVWIGFKKNKKKMLFFELKKKMFFIFYINGTVFL